MEGQSIENMFNFLEYRKRKNIFLQDLRSITLNTSVFVTLFITCNTLLNIKMWITQSMLCSDYCSRPCNDQICPEDDYKLKIEQNPYVL